MALLKGSEPPDTSAQMLERGCGQGLGLCVMAAGAAVFKTQPGIQTRLGVFVEKTLPMIRRLGGVKR